MIINVRERCDLGSDGSTAHTSLIPRLDWATCFFYVPDSETDAPECERSHSRLFSGPGISCAATSASPLEYLKSLLTNGMLYWVQWCSLVALDLYSGLCSDVF